MFTRQYLGGLEKVSLVYTYMENRLFVTSYPSVVLSEGSKSVPPKAGKVIEMSDQDLVGRYLSLLKGQLLYNYGNTCWYGCHVFPFSRDTIN